MDRLTKPNNKYTSFKSFRLQQYENTGLTPDEIAALRTQLTLTEKALELACKRIKYCHECPVETQNCHIVSDSDCRKGIINGFLQQARAGDSHDR